MNVGAAFRSIATSASLPRSLAAIGLLSILAVWPGNPGWGLASKWAVVSIGISLCLFWVKVRITPAHVLGGMLLVWAYITLSWSPVVWDALNGIFIMAVCAGAFCLGSNCRDLGPLWKASSIGLGLSALVALMQWHGYFQWGYVVPGGLFSNKNFMGEAAAVVTVGLCLTKRGWMFLPGSLSALYLAHCHGAYLGLGIAALVWAWPKSKALVAVIIAIGLACALYLLTQHQAQSDLNERFMIWDDIYDGLTFWGHGIGSLWVALPEHGIRLFVYTAQRADHAHDDALEILFELGWPGFLLAVAFVVASLSAARQGAGLVLVCFLGTGLVGFPSHEPVTVLLGFVAAGNSVAVRYGLFSPVALVRDYDGAGHRQHQRERIRRLDGEQIA